LVVAVVVVVAFFGVQRYSMPQPASGQAPDSKAAAPLTPPSAGADLAAPTSSRPTDVPAPGASQAHTPPNQPAIRAAAPTPAAEPARQADETAKVALRRALSVQVVTVVINTSNAQSFAREP
jgi:hypothetical protein